MAYIVVSGIHGGTYGIKNTEEVLKQLFHLQRGDSMSIRNIGLLRIRKIDTHNTIWDGVERRFLYISADQVTLIKN
jgi:hypothetical protein